jgi:DNA repair exonuclease SbcCD ATPase subunit
MIMDIATISTAYSGLKYAKEVLTALLNAKIEAETILRIHEVLQKLGDAQDTLFALREERAEYQEENAKLREQLKAIDQWSIRAQQYNLVQTSGAVVYRYKSSPDHFACPVCFEKHLISILQDRHVKTGTFDCPACKAAYDINYRR